METKSDLKKQIDPLMLKGDCLLKEAVSLTDAVFAKKNGIDIFSPKTDLKKLKNHPSYLRFIHTNTRPEPGKMKIKGLK